MAVHVATSEPGPEPGPARETPEANLPAKALDTGPLALRIAARICLSSQAPMVMVRGDDLQMLCNDACCQMLGATQPDMPDAIHQAIRSVIETGHAASVEDVPVVVERDGFSAEAYLSWSCSPIADDSGVHGVFATVTDTTLRVLATRRVAHPVEDAAETAFEHHDPFYSISSKLASELELERMLQLIIDEATLLVGAEFGVFGPTFHGDSVVRVDDITEDPHYRENEAYRGMPATRRLVRSYLAAPIVARSGEVIGGLFFGHSQPGMFAERTERVLAAIAAQGAIAIDNSRLYDRVRDLLESEREARHAAEEANRAKDEFLAVLGHELRNPLAPIQTALQLMSLRGDPQTKEREVLERQVGHLIRLVDDLLDVSRITRGKIDLSKEKIELSAIVTEAIEMASPLVEQKRHRLTVSVPQEGYMIDVDPGRLAQVVSNLLTNAAKYTPAGGELALTARRTDCEIVLEVRDNGIGIPAETLGRVFEPFVQDQQALDRARGGLGLGLTIVRNFVHLHGGSVTAQSEGTGMGSTFTVTLPAASIEFADDTQITSPVPAPKVNVRRVLVVDDNVDAAELVVATLSALGHHAVAAHDGPSALGVAERMRPHVALLDIGLPVMDGYELARKLRELPELRDVRLVALTGYGTDSDRARSLDAGFDEHLVKPLALDRLEAVLDVPATT